MVSRKESTLTVVINKTISRSIFYVILTMVSNHRMYSIKKLFLKKFPIFTEKHLCWSFFLIKLKTFRPATLLKRDANTVFVCKFATFLRTSIFKNICEGLLLIVFVTNYISKSKKQAKTVKISSYFLPKKTLNFVGFFTD